MTVEELNELYECNELDILFKIIDIAESMKPRTEAVLGGSGAAGAEMRKRIQDIRILSEVFRDMIQLRRGRGKKIKGGGKSKLEMAIDKEKARVAKEDEKIERAEKRRRGEI